MPIEQEAEQYMPIINESVVLDLLGSHQKMNPESPPVRTVIFLDWDDTLLCSSVLAKRGLKLDADLTGDDDLLAQLDALSLAIIEVLDAARSLGEVHIVTNGQTGWVELSAQKFVPRVVPALKGVPILSARSTFEDRFPGQPIQWKYHAFEEVLVEVFSAPCLRNILSFGDSNAEREAIRALTAGLPSTRCKSIKLMDRPSIEQLQRQLELLLRSFPSLCAHADHLDLRLSPLMDPLMDPLTE